MWGIAAEGLNQDAFLLREVLLQADASGIDLRGYVFADIPVVPGFVDDPCQVAFIHRIAEDKTVFPAVGHEPFLGHGLRL